MVENHNRRFEVNICGRLVDNNKCGGNITTICDVMSSKVYAVGCYKNDKLIFDFKTKSLKLIQHEKVSRTSLLRQIILKCYIIVKTHLILF